MQILYPFVKHHRSSRVSQPIDRNSTITRNQTDRRIHRSEASKRVVAKRPGYFKKITPINMIFGDFMSDVHFAFWAQAYSLPATCYFLLLLATLLSQSNLVLHRSSWEFDLRTTFHGCPVVPSVILTSRVGRSSHFFDRISTSRPV